MGPRPVDCLELANDSFFEKEPPLAPAKYLRDCGFALKAIVNRVPHHSMMEVNLARPPAGFESEPTAALAHAAHLQNLCGRKLVQVANERVTRIDPFSRVALGALKGGNDLPELTTKSPIAALGGNDCDFLLHRTLTQTLIFRLNQDQDFE